MSEQNNSRHCGVNPPLHYIHELAVTYEVTDNLPSGEPWPPCAPPSELWTVVNGSTAFTTWRRIHLARTSILSFADVGAAGGDQICAPSKKGSDHG